MDISLGKTKKKTHSEARFLRGELNRLRKELAKKNQEINQLRNQLGVASGDIVIEEPKEVPDCPVCGKGKLKEVFAIANKVFYDCSHCEERTTIHLEKSNGEKKN